MKRLGTSRRKTRQKFKKHFRKKGKISLQQYFQTFEEGERVILSVEPAVQKGMYFPRFIGKSAIVKGKTGKCYEVLFKDGNKDKCLLVHPVHLKKVENGSV